MNLDETAGVVAPPPLIFIGGFVAGFALDWLSGFPGLFLPWPIRDLVGLGLVAGGVRLLLQAVRLFRAAGTPVPPWEATTALVAAGPYRWSRNPIYLAMALIQTGLALLCDAIFALFAVAPVLLVVHQGVVLREEAYLLARFGEPYRRYLGQVRRWL